MYYPATFMPHEDGSGRYDVAFFDIPGCYSQGQDLEHALIMAQEALSLHVSSM
ncbi:MAG: type II toxin-antitoxin system HicB family antitoxin [Desulfarculales bacterium]|nr:type II toxin-antitoxin system HicB family antitoxin [Desulfarculales bacterium]